MSEQSVRRLVRALVIACVVPLLIAQKAGEKNLPVIAYLVIVGSGAGFAWVQPGVRSLFGWAGASWVATVMLLLMARPESMHAKDGGWRLMNLAMAFATPVMLFAVPMLALWLYLRRPIAEGDVIGRRLRRVVSVACLLGLVIIGVGFWSPTYQHLGMALGVGVYVALVLAPGAYVYRSPRAGFAWLWLVWMLPFVGIAYLADFDHAHDEWQLGVIASALGTLFALLGVVMPLIALTSRNASELPTARVA